MAAKRRYSNSEDWDTDWFLGLPPRMKCVRLWLRDNCDGGGFKRISFKRLSEAIGEIITRAEFDLHFGDRVHWVDDETVWFVQHLDEQQVLNPTNIAHVNTAKMVIRNVTGQALPEKGQSVLLRLLEIVKIWDQAHAKSVRASDETRASSNINISLKHKTPEGGAGETNSSTHLYADGRPIDWAVEAEWCFQACRKFELPQSANARAWLGEWRWEYLTEIGGLPFVRALKPNAYEVKRLAKLIEASELARAERSSEQARTAAMPPEEPSESAGVA